MVESPKDRIEIVLMSDDASPIRLWVQSTADVARRYEHDKTKSLQIAGGFGIFLLLMLFLAPAATVILLLVGVMIVFPMSLVGMIGYSRGKSSA